MTITVRTNEARAELIIKVRGRFDFELYREFREAYDQEPAPASRFVVDLVEATYIDSSALGMLLLLREYAAETNGQVALQVRSGSVARILRVANFDQLFEFEELSGSRAS
ncbi:STAS domain-containing protein [Persicimonas caeni]|uniref:STAS domain-containing protein n=1 Tax=Persicimonas caeni TaxID=2292766 RepID=A0A4Y6PZZ7_PERCE|nr:STAS domain-containing protein [Persicimonas caeni]QDG53577.1 STAS domain-containing protein [Persicimonas caeni]QED34798.1 STAS domain-containing protein [Persicimonas caeni]